jgi:hypothetical protein
MPPAPMLRWPWIWIIFPRWRMQSFFPSTTHYHSDVTHISWSLHSPVSHPSPHLNITSHHITSPTEVSGRLPPFPVVSAHCSSESLGATTSSPLGITAAVIVGSILFWVSFRVFHYTFHGKCLSIGYKVSPCKRTRNLFLFVSNN